MTLYVYVPTELFGSPVSPEPTLANKKKTRNRINLASPRLCLYIYLRARFDGVRCVCLNSTVHSGFNPTKCSPKIAFAPHIFAAQKYYLTFRHSLEEVRRIPVSNIIAWNRTNAIAAQKRRSDFRFILDVSFKYLYIFIWLNYMQMSGDAIYTTHTAKNKSVETHQTNTPPAPHVYFWSFRVIILLWLSWVNVCASLYKFQIHLKYYAFF